MRLGLVIARLKSLGSAASSLGKWRRFGADGDSVVQRFDNERKPMQEISGAALVAPSSWRGGPFGWAPRLH